jgi:hypothetical protein
MWATILNIIIGLGLILVPAYLPMNKEMMNNYYITSPLIITAAITALWEVNRSARYLTFMGGLWLILSPFIFGTDDSLVKWITISAGGLLVVFSSIKGKIKGSYGGGWRSLFQKNPLHAR